ncbi:hypothetical protein N7492_005554 [Penicillium capsulatum]|uniref:Uncharacterized protein n=1 Tax=Penicillium capsulatum TaxID=69766 RepID=A0A9W9LRS1_9EURO|nr:hypothetical protein N7492_005554 [Penicillium capsulatum]KAJ6135346.1 hypothetical protein N7512_000506 [Penicillium capsulatum]
MQPCKGSDFLEAGTATRSRTSSISSDSQLPRVNLMSPPSVRPPPAFISSAAASEIISSDQEFNAADFAEEDGTGTGANALVTPAALSLLNGFLDNLLFNVLGSSKSTQLICIRPAVSDVLRPRLAQEVVATADEELSEYMGGAEDEEIEFRGGQEPGGDFDLVRSWKLTRLRCMVYTRLGDMEEEDEDEFIVQDGLGECDGGPRRFSSHVDNITPAAAIFLTSIIEHIGERALVIAGETARSRLSAKLNHSENASVDSVAERKRIDRLVVEDLDMEKLALNATLGRLWRTWRKRRRATTLSRTVSRESFRRRGYSFANSRKSSIATIEEPITPQEPLPEELPAPVDPATIPLPMSDHDVQEIEVPGYSAELEGEVQTMEAVVAHKVRPRSLMVFSSPSLAPRSPGSGESPVSASAVENVMSLRHLRSRSLPNAPSSLPSPATEGQSDEERADQPSPSNSEEKKQLETMYEDDESAEYVDAAESTAESAPGLAITTENDESTDAVADETLEKARMSVVPEEDEEVYPDFNEIVATLRPRDETVENASMSSRVSISSLSDYGEDANDSEVIEGHGLRERPTLTSSIQRPRRKPSKDVNQVNAKPISAGTSDLETQSVVDAPRSTQGGESTQAPPPTTVEAINSPSGDDAINGDRNKSTMTSTPEPIPSTEEIPEPSEVAVKEPTPREEDAAAEEVAVEKHRESTTPSESRLAPETPRPESTSGDSERSQRSRRPRPSPLVVTASNRGSPSAGERAAVQRVPIRSSTSVSSSIHTKSRRSESFSSAREKRPVTAGSTTSQVSHKLKGLMGRPQTESPSLRLRSSSETSRASGSADSADNDTTDLDKLINSDETIHYTLTPRSVREMTFPDVPRPIPRSDTQDTTDLAEFLKTTAPPGDHMSRSRGSVSSRATGEVTSLGRIKSVESPKHIPLSPRIASPAKGTFAQARDARMTNDGTREFVEFIKSTGPTSAPYQQSPVAESFRGSRPQSNFSVSSSTSRSNKPRLQARPAETRSSQTSDLIDFIREGPPQPGGHRIPRTVAPFRNTIDSDDIQLDSQNEKDQPRSSLSTRDGSTPNKSLTSLGSRTGLLNSNNRSNGQAKGQVTGSKAMPPQDDPRPPRNQRRAPDPYAIDDDEDDDALFEEFMGTGSAKPQREESLIDFLRSAPPPEFEQTPQPLNVKVPPSPSSSTGGMKVRLLGSSSGKSPVSKLSIASLRSQSSAKTNNANSEPPQSNYSTKVSIERNPGTMPSASHRQTETSALADFLRNTGPPEPPRTPSSPGFKEGGFSRFFARRKKVEV